MGVKELTHRLVCVGGPYIHRVDLEMRLFLQGGVSGSHEAIFILAGFLNPSALPPI